MDFYISGVLVAFAIRTIILFISLIELFSLKAQNLRKVGLHYHPIQGNYTKEKPQSWKAGFFSIVGNIVFSSLLSWIEVGFVVFNFIKVKLNRPPVPEKLKEIQYRLSSLNLPKEQVRNLLNETASLLGINGPPLDERILDEDDPDTYVIGTASDAEPDEWHREIQLNMQIKNYTMYMHTPDYDFQSWNTYEYKFMDNQVWQRQIEDKHDGFGFKNPEWEIKDNVVLEHDVRSRAKESRLKNRPEEIEEKILQLKRDVEWHEQHYYKIKWFIMFRHSDIFTESELKKYMRFELERITLGYKNLENEIARLGGAIQTHEFAGKYVSFDDKLPEEVQKKLNAILEEGNIREFGITNWEFHESDEIKLVLEKYLSILSKG